MEINLSIEEQNQIKEEIKYLKFITKHFKELLEWKSKFNAETSTHTITYELPEFENFSFQLRFKCIDKNFDKDDKNQDDDQSEFDDDFDSEIEDDE